MSASQMNRQYQAPKIPQNWSSDEKRFANGMLDIIDEIYLKYGRLSEADLSKRLRETISDTANQTTLNTTEIQQSAAAIRLLAEQTEHIDDNVQQNTAAIDASAKQIFLGVSSADFGSERIVKSDTAPENPDENTLWIDTANGMLIKRWDGENWIVATAQELRNSGIAIDANGIVLETTGEIIARVDGDTRMEINENGVTAPLLYADEVHAPNVVERLLDSTIPWKGGVQASIDACPKYLNKNSTLTIPAGVYEEDVNVVGFMGDTLTIKFSEGAYLNGYMEVRNCAHVVVTADELGHGFIYPRSAVSSALRFYGVPRAHVSNMHISGYRDRLTASGGSDIALYFNSCHALVENCCLEYANKGLSCNYAIVFANGNSGGTAGTNPETNANLTYGVLASSGSHVHLVGNYPVGGKEDYGVYRGVINTYDLGSATAGGMLEPGQEAVTKTWTLTKHCTYLYGVSRIRDDQGTVFSQGRYGAYASGGLEWRIGCIWFGDALSELAGREIHSATLRIRRAAGGFNEAIPVYLGTANVLESEYLSTLTPSFTAASTFPVGSITKNQEGVYDVTGLMAAFIKGHALAVRETPKEYGYKYSDNYAQYYGLGSDYQPQLTVTYS